MGKPKVEVIVGEVFGEPCLLAALAGSEEASILKKKERGSDPEERTRKVILTFMGCLLIHGHMFPAYRFEFEK